MCIGHGIVDLSLNSNVVGNLELVDNLYKLSLAYNNEYNNMNVESVVPKRPLIKERSSLLWHKRLSHIFDKRINGLIKDSSPPFLDFDYLDTCVNSVIGRLTKIKKKKAF